MTTTTYRVRRYYTDGHNLHGDGWTPITLPAIPGVRIDGDRSDTAPQARTIRAATRKRRAASPERQIDAVAHAICAARADIQPTVTTVIGGEA